MSRCLRYPPLSAMRLQRLSLLNRFLASSSVFLVRFFHARNASRFNDDDTKRSKRWKIWSASKNRTNDDDLSGGSSASGLFLLLPSFHSSLLLLPSSSPPKPRRYWKHVAHVSLRAISPFQDFPRCRRKRENRDGERESEEKGSTKKPVPFVLSLLGLSTVAASSKPTCRRFCRAKRKGS